MMAECRILGRRRANGHASRLVLLFGWRQNVKHAWNRLRFFHFHKMSLGSAATFLTKTHKSKDVDRITIFLSTASTKPRIL
jgi:hypothetical protein